MVTTPFSIENIFLKSFLPPRHDPGYDRWWLH